MESTIVTGTIGHDSHMVGISLIEYSLREAGFHVASIGACVSQEEFINAAIETKADAILVSSVYGMGVFDCEGLRDKCNEAGLNNILLYVGGRLTTGAAGGWTWEQTEEKFKAMGFNRVYPPDTLPAAAIADLKKDLQLIDS
ncbi:Glutamate mutase sigma subunit [subsurface metagenome]